MRRCRLAACALLAAAAVVLGSVPFPQAASAGTVPPPVRVTATADPVLLTAWLASPTIRYGQADSISGTVQQESDGDFQPLAATPVTLGSDQPGSPDITVSTNSLGDFTAQLPAQKATGHWTVSAGGTTLLDRAQQVLTLNVQQATAIRHVDLSLSAFRELSVRACLRVTSPGGSGEPVEKPITLQYERSAKGPWKKLATIDPAGGSSYCATGLPVWQAMVAAPAANAYYRLSFAGDPGLQPSASAARHRWRYRTRVTSFSISPRRVAAKRAVTVSGRLWRRTSSWHPDAGRKVAILFRYRGVWYEYQDEPRTSSRGYFSGRFTAYVTAQWVAQYNGNKRHYGSASSPVRVTVTSGAVELPGAARGARGLRRAV